MWLVFFYYIGCKPGYFDVNCSQKCIFPTYGVKCQERCSCQKEFCNFSSGCSIGDETYGDIFSPLIEIVLLLCRLVFGFSDDSINVFSLHKNAFKYVFVLWWHNLYNSYITFNYSIYIYTNVKLIFYCNIHVHLHIKRTWSI